MITRFAPSPTGDLHLGGAYVALASWWMSKSYASTSSFPPEGREIPHHGENGERRASMANREAPLEVDGAFVLRVEDIDRPRVVAGSAARILDDLRWLGLDWDEGPFVQSERTALYDAALEDLKARGLIYPCDCSRTDIARAASAPHAGEETVYPGICRNRDPARPMKRPPSWRLRVPDAAITVVDEIAGPITQNLERDVGDFVLRRGDGIDAYQLAVVVDDLAMGITDVVRGADLLGSTPRQVHLARLLSGPASPKATLSGPASPKASLRNPPPRFHHLPLVLDARGERLAKRTPGAHIRALRAAGISAAEIVGELACALGLATSPAPCMPEDLSSTTIEKLAPYTFRIPPRWDAMASR